jgi:hypothetical protein
LQRFEQSWTIVVTTLVLSEYFSQVMLDAAPFIAFCMTVSGQDSLHLLKGEGLWQV